MPKLNTKEAQIKFDMLNDLRRNGKNMSMEETEQWIHSDKSLREFLGSKRFIEKGFRMNKNGEMKLK